MVELADNILVAASGDQGDVEMFVEWLKVRVNLRRLWSRTSIERVGSLSSNYDFVALSR